MEQIFVLRDLAVIFAGSLLVILAFHRLKLPALPGFIVAGILLGPNALGLVTDPHRVESLAEVGVILLLFTIGIEFSLSRLKEMGRQVIAAGSAQMAFTVLASLAVGQRAPLDHSHSIVEGGFEVMSYTTRFTPATSFTIRFAIRPRTS